MSKVNAGWSAATEDGALLTYLYSFGGGLATALAVRGPKGYVVVSPPYGAPDAAFSELETKGPIAAIVAPNAFHTMGIAPWSRRFPHAKLLAAAQSIPRVSKKTGAPFAAVADAGAVVDESVELTDMPHFRNGEVLVRARTPNGVVWYVTDIVLNLPSVPKPLPVGLLFKWTGSAPGLKLNRVGPTLTVRDKPALYRWLLAELEREQPTRMLLAHGKQVDMTESGDALRALLAKRA